MELIEFGELELTYTTLEIVEYGNGAQIYGTMDGTVTGERVKGSKPRLGTRAGGGTRAG
jgi:hypothetical protein